MSETPAPRPVEPVPQTVTNWDRISFLVQFVLSVAVAAFVLAKLTIWSEPHTSPHHEPPQASFAQVVEAVGPSRIRVDASSLLADKLDYLVVEQQTASVPKLRSAGTVIASLRPIGEEESERDQWQFHDPEVLENYYEWRRAELDIAFSRDKIERVRKLAELRYSARKKVVDRLERLVQAGTDSVADLEEARAELLEAELESHSDLYEAETELRVAQQEEAVVVRKLQLAGLDPAMLSEATSEVDIVVADVPEESQRLVRVGQECEARFFGQRQLLFPGVVRKIIPVLSPERRALRVLFFVNDPDDKLLPGMFADIKIGVEKRDVILIPETCIIHIGREDYVLRQSAADQEWDVVPIEVGDSLGGRAEVYAGLNAGDRIVSQGAILLKPAAALSLQGHFATENSAPAEEAGEDISAQSNSAERRLEEALNMPAVATRKEGF